MMGDRGERFAATFFAVPFDTLFLIAVAGGLLWLIATVVLGDGD